MTSLDEYFDQYLNKQFTQKLGADYEKIRNNIDRLIEANNKNCDEIGKLKLDIKKCFDGCKSLQDAINKKMYELDPKIGKIEILETLIKKINDNQSQYGQQINNKITDLENKNTALYDNILIKVLALEAENRKLSQIVGEKETNDNKFQTAPKTFTRNELFNQSDNSRNDDIITIFNDWAAKPVFSIPRGFSYVAGDFRMRKDQQEITETQEETKWIINRGEGKKYLLPNPNFFYQMTNITELYNMDLSKLKAKGKNKIKIITPCEISSSGFIEFPGELKIL